MLILIFTEKAFPLFISSFILFVTKYIKINEKVKEESSMYWTYFWVLQEQRGFNLVAIRFQV